jgi:pyrroline-5-carboxylate reductase
MSENDTAIGIIGCGHMGSSFAKRLGLRHPLILCDDSFEKAKITAQEVGGTAVKSCSDLVEQVKWILLAVKPKDLSSIANELGDKLTHSHLIISMLAGTPLEVLQNNFGSAAVIRIMPNMAVAYGQGVIGLAEHESISHETKEKLESLFSPLGMLYWLPEDQIDALTALTASGPAFVFVMIEAMVDAAIAMGFSSSDALPMVVQMMTGSLVMLNETKKHPAELKWQISSPAGTTIEGLNQMENDRVRAGIINAFLAARNRAKKGM